MKQTTHSSRPLAALMCGTAWVLLAACGGDPLTGSAGLIPTNSVGEFSTYVGTQPADERSEPVDVEAVLPPTSETAEPVDVT